jgi:glycosyltransferase involved in cell wall biosynthesis
MKITIVLGAFFPVPPTMGGAIEKVWYDLGREFARRGHEVVMISRRTADLPGEEILEGVRHLRVRGFDSPGSLLLLKILDLIYSWGVRRILPASDIIVTNTFWLPIFRRGAYVHVGRYPKGQMRSYGGAVRLQAPSRAIADAIKSEVPALAEKVRMIPYPAPSPVSLSAPPPLGERPKVILYVGRVHPEKGVHLLVEAFEQPRTVFADWKLMIVGPVEGKFGGGGEDYLRKLKRSGNPRVVFAGAIFDRAALETQLRGARIFVYPSLAERGESFGLAPLEAMTQRCAVLVSKLACFSDFVHDHATGFVFDHRVSDPATALADALEKIMTEPAVASGVADAGLSQSAEFALPRIADQFLSDFESIVTHA